MVKSGKRGREDGDSYDSDGGFVSNDEAPKSKKTKKAGGSSKDGPENKFWGVSYYLYPSLTSLLFTD